ncbi:MAG TPA: beta-ketoacyl-ACP synthase III [Lacipirellulaceae bacterium]|jgi:3-oxoacyl-[acyl-carrier-protein] synthase-3|nr:beta-ketoacyl-ACP synthase III [Lacipirellulaceae bacterium]
MSDAEILSPARSPIRQLTGVQIIGTGSYVPENVVTNEDLASLGCDADWIIQRTGIRERRHAPPEISTSDMAVAAAERCIAAAELDRNRIDLLVLGTLSPDYLLPATAAAVQERLQLNCPAMDVSAACAGFMYALITGMQYVATGCSEFALVIGADTNSRVMNPDDKKTYPLFGDGAGAVLITRGSPEQGLLSYTLGADGSGEKLLIRLVGGSRTPFQKGQPIESNWFVTMDGRPVFKWAVRLLEDSSRAVLSAAGFTQADVKLWLFHQANIRILDAAADGLGIERTKCETHIDRYGNTSAGSVPIALDESFRAGRFGRKDLLMMSGFGGGLAWGTALMRW